MAEQSNPGQKALLVGIALALVGAGFGAYVQFGGESTRPDTSISSTPVKVQTLTQQVDAFKAFLGKSREAKDFAPKGLTIGGEPRLTPLLFAPELWQVTLDATKENRVIDIYDPAAANIHAPIPNLWFIQNGLAQELGLADGALQDSDKDGFTNMEEYEASTNPSDPKSYPSLVAPNKTPKLVVNSVVTTRAIITADAMLAYETAEPAEVGVKIFAKAGEVNPIKKFTLKKGDKFGVDDKAPERFTVVGFEKRDFVDLSGTANPEMMLQLHDSAAPAGEQDFVIRAGKPREKDKDKGTPNEKGKLIQDTVVSFEATAGSKMGTPEAIVKAKLHTEFLLPGDDKTKYIIETCDDNGSVNIRVAGENTTAINIPKPLLSKKTPKDKEK